MLFLSALSLFHVFLFVTNSEFNVFIEVKPIDSIVLMKNDFVTDDESL